jgi:hypothetical protein
MEGGQEGGKEHGGGAKKGSRGKAFTARQLESNFMPAEGGMGGGQEGGKGHGGGDNKGGRGGMEGEQEGGKEHGGDAKKGGSGKAFTFPELMCCMWAALGTNERFSAGAATAVRLQSVNTAYTQRVKWMKEQDKWRDQYGKPVTDITPEESICLRVQEVDTKTKQTPISYQQARIITVCRNELAPLLDKIVDKDGKIPSCKQVSDIQEELRVAYFNSLTSDNPPEPVSSEDEATKAECLDILATARTNKLLKFHSK